MSGGCARRPGSTRPGATRPGAGIGLLAIALAAAGCASTLPDGDPQAEPDADPDGCAHRGGDARHRSARDVDGRRPRGRHRTPGPIGLADRRCGRSWPIRRCGPTSPRRTRAPPSSSAAVDELNGRAEPAFIAVDPAAAGSDGPLAANLSVLVAQPSVGGPLLDLVAGFICDSLTDALGAPASPERERERLPIGDAVRCTYDLPADGGEPLVAEAWVIGAPSATVLVTLLGPAAATDGVTARAIVEAITPVPLP